MTFNDEQKALIREVAREVILEVSSELKLMVDDRIKMHRLECSNGKYVKSVSALIAVTVSVVTMWIRDKFFGN